jgi:hypothetical protein
MVVRTGRSPRRDASAAQGAAAVSTGDSSAVPSVDLLAADGKTKVVLISLVSCVTLLGLAHADGALGPPADADRRWALDHLFSDHADVGGVSLSLLQDPAGLIVLAVILVTPVFCCQQVLAISLFVQMNERDEGILRRPDEQARQLDVRPAGSTHGFVAWAAERSQPASCWSWPWAQPRCMPSSTTMASWRRGIRPNSPTRSGAPRSTQAGGPTGTPTANSHWMVFIVLGVMLVDMLVIVYPSSIGYHWALAVKQAYAASLYESGLPSDERDAAIAQVWSVPVLPVTTRKATTGIILYLLVPAVPQ